MNVMEASPWCSFIDESSIHIMYTSKELFSWRTMESTLIQKTTLVSKIFFVSIKTGTGPRELISFKHLSTHFFLPKDTSVFFTQYQQKIKISPGSCISIYSRSITGTCICNCKSHPLRTGGNKALKNSIKYARIFLPSGPSPADSKTWAASCDTTVIVPTTDSWFTSPFGVPSGIITNPCF